MTRASLSQDRTVRFKIFDVSQRCVPGIPGLSAGKPEEIMTAAIETAIAADDSAKRRQILDGARRVFLEHGFDGASVNDIVRATGVSKGTIYAYFPSKERLF